MTVHIAKLIVILLVFCLSTIIVQGQPVSYSITSITPLNFGDVMPGASVAIDPSTPQAAVISISRSTSANATSNVNIALPVSFNSGSASIPITMSASDVQLIVDNGNPTNPASLPNISFQLGGGGGRTLQVRIGGSVTIPVDTVPGLYTGTFTITISNTAL